MKRSRRHVILAALIALLWIATPIASVLHIALASHSYCAEHDALEEGAGHQAPLSLAAPEAETSQAAKAERGVERNSDVHAACAFGDPATRDAFALDTVLHVASAPAFEPCTVARSTRALAPRSRLFLQAPKNSPPARS